MDEIFSKRPYLVVRMPSARAFARKKRSRNERQRSRNLLMRNLLTAFGANRNYEMCRKVFLGELQTFSTAGVQSFSIARLQKLVGARISSYVRYRALGRKNFSAKIEFPFRRNEKFAAQIARNDADRITAILLLPFAVNCR